jgi:hypothetical protein
MFTLCVVKHNGLFHRRFFRLAGVVLRTQPYFTNAALKKQLKCKNLQKMI